MAKAIAKTVTKAATKKAVAKAAPNKNAKKAAVSKPVVKKAKPKKGPTIKYADKSAGQPELVPVFEAIKKMILPYAGKRALKILAETYGQINLISHKPVVIEGRPRNELWFVSALIQRGYVGFYNNPFYLKGEMKKEFSAEFSKCLRGKGCFHIKTTDPVIMKDIEKAIKIGYEEYVKQGWL